MTGPRSTPGRRRDAKRELPPHVNVSTRGDKAYFYFHPNRDRSVKPVRINHDPSESAFWTEYDRLMEQAGLQNPTIENQILQPGSVGALVEEYLNSSEHKRKRRSTAKFYEYYLPLIKEHFRNDQVSSLLPSTIQRQSDGFGERTGAATNYLRTFSMLLTWGAAHDYGLSNPALAVPKPEGGSIKPWPWAAVLFAKKHMRLHMWAAVATAVYTGQRKSDCLAMKWSSIGNGEIEVAVNDAPPDDSDPGVMSESKAMELLYKETGISPQGWDMTQQKTNKRLTIAMHREYAEVLEQLERRAVTVLTTQKGRPWRSGFHASWVKELDRPPLAPLKALGLTFHGLRKTAVGKMLEAGCTTAEAQAVTGHSLQMLEYYSKGVDQETLAKQAMRKWEAYGK